MIKYESDITKYRIISTLGQCFESMAIVNLAKHLTTGTMIALKRFKMDKIKDEYHLVEREIILTRQLQHPNIITYNIAFVNDLEVCVVSPLMAFGSCRDILNNHFHEGLPENAVILIMHDLLHAIDYIHRKGFIHRAIRCSHLLISANGRVCLSGLRYACPIIFNGRWQKRIHSFPTSTAPNLNWLSPELLEQNLQGYNEKSDIYSIGMVLCELANGMEPFSGFSTTLMLTEKIRGSAPQLLDVTTVPKNNDNSGDFSISPRIANRRFSEGLHEIANLCLQREAFARPTANQLLTHPVFKLTKKGLHLPDLLKPAIPLSDRMVFNTDEITNLDSLNHLSELEFNLYEWNFDNT